MAKLRIGFIGSGGIAHGHVSQLLDLEDVEIAAIADPSQRNTDLIVSSIGLHQTRIYHSHKDMLNAGGLDAVVICSPHTLHYEHASDALDSGCHVLIEKPMTCSSKEAEQLIGKAEDQGKLLQVSYQRHFQPEFIYIREAIASGLIGKLTSVNATLYQDWQKGQTGTWRQIASLSGGGMLMDSGSHIIDMLLWTTGLTPVEVKASINTNGAPVEIDSFTSIRFEEGALAALNIIGHVPGFNETYGYCGDKGVIYYNNGHITVQTYSGEAIAVELPPRVTNQDKSFVDAIRGKHEVLVSGEYALKVIRLTEAIYSSGGYEPLESRNTVEA
ncbi:Gfo/Idh/MocA family protein [Paenibacillus mendelii]|uniref:Gfo/Idh/MocA family protein n=1 Tax=Paenibacillus mendelii TaxID=206163 RepID=A0ABV6J6J6_9BACL|nr:Gfo/Idh/MocA family oxidoreductase [Paenibacillus mendelii]MCQ6561164.1 Gfo/Idh/MocA family oxidoreductase [Paenibacillus mendelii]